jgi:DNA replication protein DnaC
VIAEHLKALKLPSFAREYQALARRAADGSWAYEDYLRELLEVELADREERTAERRLRGAKFPER